MGELYDSYLYGQNHASKMLAAANKRIAELIKENKELKYELEIWKKRYEECEHRKHFEEISDYER